MLTTSLVAATLAVVATLPAAPQEPQPAPSPRAELARLAALVNGLDSFDAVFSLQAEDEGEVVVELLYAAPDRARLRSTIGNQVHTAWFVDGVLHSTERGPGLNRFARFDAQRFMAEVPSVQTVLATQFPELRPPGDLGPGPVFHIEPNLGVDGRGAAIQLTISFARVRPALFCWAFEHRAQLGEPILTDDSLVFGDPDTAYLQLSRTNGFPVRFRGRGGSGLVTLELLGLDLNPELEPTELQPPAPSEGAEDSSGPTSVQSRRPFTPQLQRRDAHEALLGFLVRGELEWNEGTRARTVHVFTELHRLFLPNRFEDLIAGSDATSAEEVERILRDHGDHPLDDRQSEVEQVRQHIRNSMQVVRERYLTPLSTQIPLRNALNSEDPDLLRHRVQLLEVELEAAGALFDETVSGPILEAFELRARSLLR